MSDYKRYVALLRASQRHARTGSRIVKPVFPGDEDEERGADITLQDAKLADYGGQAISAEL